MKISDILIQIESSGSKSRYPSIRITNWASYGKDDFDVCIDNRRETWEWTTQDDRDEIVRELRGLRKTESFFRELKKYAKKKPDGEDENLCQCGMALQPGIKCPNCDALEESSDESKWSKDPIENLWKILTGPKKPVYQEAIRNWAEEREDESLSNAKNLEDIPKELRSDFISWFEEYGDYYGYKPASQENPSAYMKPIRRLKPNEWLIHFTDQNPMKIVKNGFTVGSNWYSLHLTRNRSENTRLTSQGPFAFAFLAESEEWFDTGDSGAYGADAVIFQCSSGILVDHLTDVQEQVIFDRKKVSNIFAAKREGTKDDWFLLDQKTGKPIDQEDGTSPLHILIEKNSKNQIGK